MAESTAKQYSGCVFCKKSACKEKLYQCTKQYCEQYLEIYCSRCGQISHEELDHDFDIKSQYVKEYRLDVVESDIQEGKSVVKHLMDICAVQRLDSILPHIFATYWTSAYDVNVGRLLVVWRNHPSAKWWTHRKLMRFQKYSTYYFYTAANACSGIAYYSYLFARGHITTWKEYGYYVTKSMASSIGAGMGKYAGTAIAVKMANITGLGTVGTFIAAVIGGVLGSNYGISISRAVFDKFWSNNFIKQKQSDRNKMVEDALRLFGILQMKDIENPAIFNEKELKKTYRMLARKYHPDKNGGTAESHARFHEINAALGILLSLLERKDKVQTVNILERIEAIQWRENNQLPHVMNNEKEMDEVDHLSEMEAKSADSNQKSMQLLEDLDKVNEDLDSLISGDEEYHGLMYQLKNEGLIFILDICQQFNKELTIKTMLEFRKTDILELIDEINDEKMMSKKISVIKKNKFAKILSDYASERPFEQCVSK